MLYNQDFDGTGVVNPFSREFEKTWEMWKSYKKEAHRFKYATFASEQAAIWQLLELSEGDEEHAKRIVNQSMANNWKGLFKVHNPKKDKKDGEPKKKATGRATPDDLYAAYIKPTGTEG
jgi:hypothetical protein